MRSFTYIDARNIVFEQIAVNDLQPGCKRYIPKDLIEGPVGQSREPVNIPADPTGRYAFPAVAPSGDGYSGFDLDAEYARKAPSIDSLKSTRSP